MNTASRPRVHAAAAPSDAGVPVSAHERAASAVTATGPTFAEARSQLGIAHMGTNTENAQTSRKTTTKQADRRHRGAEGHRLDEDPRQQVVDIRDPVR